MSSPTSSPTLIVLAAGMGSRYSGWTKVEMQLSMFEALARGYLESAGDMLTAEERRHLVFGGKLITFEQGLRFLTDVLAGDTYYKVNRPAHNLDRCRTQFKLTASIAEQEERMNELVERMGA